MTCSKCGSENVVTQIVQETKLKKKGHGAAYWLLFGWIIDLLLWFFLTIPRLIIAIFRPKKSKVVTKEKTVAVCQSCGNRWNVA